MPTAKPYIDYRRLATHIGQLPKEADCGRLAEHVAAFDEGAARRLADLLWQDCNLDGPSCVGLYAIANALKHENPRFDRGVWLDWCMEDW